MADRRRQVLLLISSRDDLRWFPPGTLRTPSGLAPQEREPCTACGGVRLLDDFGREIRRARGRGVVRDRFGRRLPCTGCGGRVAIAGELLKRGRVAQGGEIVPGAGWVARDPMDSLGVRVGSASTSSATRPRRTVPCDRCGGSGMWKGERCPTCDGDGRRVLHVFELALDLRDVDERDPLVAAIDRRNRAGSYGELDRALDELRRRAPVVARGLLAAVDHGRVLDLRLELALGFVVDRMPDPVKVPAEVRANERERREQRKRAKGRSVDAASRERRDVEIRKLVGERKPVQWVAAEFGLSVAQVNRIAGGARDDDGRAA